MTHTSKVRMPSLLLCITLVTGLRILSDTDRPTRTREQYRDVKSLDFRMLSFPERPSLYYLYYRTLCHCVRSLNLFTQLTEYYNTGMSYIWRSSQRHKCQFPNT